MHLKKFLDTQHNLAAEPGVVAYLDEDLVPLANEYAEAGPDRCAQIEAKFKTRHFALAVCLGGEHDGKTRITFAPDRPASMTPRRPGDAAGGPAQTVGG